MTVPLETLQALMGTDLPGGTLVIEAHEEFIAEEALRAAPTDDDALHPVWYVFASLRCMGITVDELCALAHQGPDDVLLFGSCHLSQYDALGAGSTYRATASIRSVGSRTAGDGSRLDSIDVAVTFTESSAGREVGEVVSTYLFKRGQAHD